LLEHQKGEFDLLAHMDNWFLSCPCDIQEDEMQNSTVMIGVDLGDAQIYTTSDGEQFSRAGDRGGKDKVPEKKN
jgi:transposase